LLVLVGGYFLVNLILAVINESFINEREKKLKEVEAELIIVKRFAGLSNTIQDKVRKLSLRI